MTTKDQRLVMQYQHLRAEAEAERELCARHRNILAFFEEIDGGPITGDQTDNIREAKHQIDMCVERLAGLTEDMDRLVLR